VRALLPAGVIAFVLVAGGCNGSDGPGDVRNAALLQTCGPTDGPAVTLFLTEQPASAEWPERPYSAITVYRDIAGVAGKRFDVSATSGSVGQGFVCPETGDCETASSASVTFGQLASDSTIAAEFRVSLAGNEIVRGSARARYHPLSQLCG